MEGWISLHRKVKEHWLWKDPIKFQWWLDILLTVNHTDKKVNIGNQIILCKRGQSIQSLQTWADQWKTSKSMVRRFFELLQSDEMICTENVQKSTRLTVCKYDTYQVLRNDDETMMKRKRNDDETHPAPNNNANNDNKKIISFSDFLNLFNSITNRNFKGDTKAKSQFNARIKEGYTLESFRTAITNCFNDEYHKKYTHHLTPEFITRPDKLEKFLNTPSVATIPVVAPKTFTTEEYEEMFGLSLT